MRHGLIQRELSAASFYGGEPVGTQVIRELGRQCSGWLVPSRWQSKAEVSLPRHGGRDEERSILEATLAGDDPGGKEKPVLMQREQRSSLLQFQDAAHLVAGAIRVAVDPGDLGPQEVEIHDHIRPAGFDSRDFVAQPDRLVPITEFECPLCEVGERADLPPILAGGAGGGCAVGPGGDPGGLGVGAAEPTVRCRG